MLRKNLGRFSKSSGIFAHFAHLNWPIRSVNVQVCTAKQIPFFQCSILPLRLGLPRLLRPLGLLRLLRLLRLPPHFNSSDLNTCMHLNFFQDIARQTLDVVIGVGYEYKQWRVLQNSGSISLPTFCSRNMTQNCAKPLFMFFVFCSGYRVFQTFKTYDVRHPLDLNVISTSDWNLKMSATYDITKLYFLLLDVFWNYGIHHSQIHMCFCMFASQLANRKGRDIKRSIQHFCMKFVWLIGILCMLALQTLKTNHSEDESSPSCWYLGPQGVFHPNSMNMSKPKETRKHWPERWSVSMFHTTKVTNRHFFYQKSWWFDQKRLTKMWWDSEDRIVCILDHPKKRHGERYCCSVQNQVGCFI